MHDKLPPLQKTESEPELVGFRDDTGLHIATANHTGTLTVADVLGESSAPVSAATEVDGGSIFKVDENGSYTSHDGSQIYNSQLKRWVPAEYDIASAEAPLRIRKLFAPFDQKDAYNNGYLNRFHRSVSTPESENAALEQLAEERKIDSVVDSMLSEKFGAETTPEAVAALRTDPVLRLSLGMHLLDKTDDVANMLPRSNRVFLNGPKRVKVAGYPDSMTSREYTAALALAMLDGTFRNEDADNIDYNPSTDTGTGGQHRVAAQLVLGTKV